MMWKLPLIAGLALLPGSALAQGLSGGCGVNNAPCVPRTVFGSLPTCTASLAGTLYLITDGVAGTANGAASAGSSATPQLTLCVSSGVWVGG
jgi:hypothetical protein